MDKNYENENAMLWELLKGSQLKNGMLLERLIRETNLRSQNQQTFMDIITRYVADEPTYINIVTDLTNFNLNET